jgi:hypothetical protein
MSNKLGLRTAAGFFALSIALAACGGGDDGGSGGTGGTGGTGSCTEGASCDDGDACTSDDTCTGGVCAGEALDCSGQGDSCNDAACNATSGQCELAAKADGSGCDDEDVCTDADSCTAGACSGTAKDCSGSADDCNAGVCNPMSGACEGDPVADGTACDDADLCTDTDSCTAGACTGSAVDCSAVADGCNAGVCNPADGNCGASPLPDNTVCDDGTTCTTTDVCTTGVCAGDDGVYFQENFDDNLAGWTLDTDWAIGPAMTGCGDPGSDHTGNGTDGIAGVTIGGCAPTPLHAYYCLTSPVVDTSTGAGAYVSFWRDLWSDYTPYMANKVEVYDGAAWQSLYQTAGAPGVDDSAWTFIEYDITAHASATTQVRWCFNIANAGVFNRGSWNVDDVLFSAAPACTECGNGVVDNGEVCDDYNADVCGTCSDTCTSVQPGDDCASGIGCGVTADCDSSLALMCTANTCQ